jgi:hypothetical protein
VPGGGGGGGGVPPSPAALTSPCRVAVGILSGAAGFAAAALLGIAWSSRHS